MIWKRRNQEEIPTSNPEMGENLNLYSGTYVLKKHVVSRVSSYFPIGGHSVI